MNHIVMAATVSLLAKTWIAATVTKRVTTMRQNMIDSEWPWSDDVKKS
jgi:hypothetical protein